jgi:hypothetical protein
VDVSILDQAAVDPDVIGCFLYNDQTAMACQRAVDRFPDIARFAEDMRFKLRFCQWIGAAPSCAPALNAVWNFPTVSQWKTSPAVKIPTAVSDIRKDDAKVAGTAKDGKGQSENKDGKGQSGNKDRKAGNGSTDSHRTDHAHVHSQGQSGAVKSSQTTGSGSTNGKVASTRLSPNAAPAAKAPEVRVSAGGPGGGGHHGR